MSCALGFTSGITLTLLETEGETVGVVEENPVKLAHTVGVVEETLVKVVVTVDELKVASTTLFDTAGEPIVAFSTFFEESSKVFESLTFNGSCVLLP